MPGISTGITLAPDGQKEISATPSPTPTPTPQGQASPSRDCGTFSFVYVRAVAWRDWFGGPYQILPADVATTKENSWEKYVGYDGDNGNGRLAEARRYVERFFSHPQDFAKEYTWTKESIFIP
ncbi:MAG: hypothetical protein EAZ33_21775, partial [Oscillatoriales cyanobacterium]